MCMGMRGPAANGTFPSIAAIAEEALSQSRCLGLLTTSGAKNVADPVEDIAFARDERFEVGIIGAGVGRLEGLHRGQGGRHHIVERVSRLAHRNPLLNSQNKPAIVSAAIRSTAISSTMAAATIDRKAGIDVGMRPFVKSAIARPGGITDDDLQGVTPGSRNRDGRVVPPSWQWIAHHHRSGLVKDKDCPLDLIKCPPHFPCIFDIKPVSPWLEIPYEPRNARAI
jgi:hypothetical protein